LTLLIAEIDFKLHADTYLRIKGMVSAKKVLMTKIQLPFYVFSLEDKSGLIAVKAFPKKEKFIADLEKLTENDWIEAHGKIRTRV
jgi:DNA polymerase III alpha subunit (gram-positive type)